MKQALAMIPKALTAKQFAKVPDAKKRMMIAEDALLTLASKQAPSLESGTYFRINREAPDVVGLHEALPQIQSSCTVCAKGAMFLSHARLFNKVALPEQGVGLYDEGVCEPLLEYFEAETLDLIEYIFESGMLGSSGYDSDDKSRADMWVKFISSPTDRFKEICHNIIRNSGDFRVEDTTFLKYIPSQK